MNYIIIIFSILLSAFFSAITIGFLGLKKTELQSRINSGNKQAKKIYAVRKNGNLLLVTMLMGNVLVNSILSVFLRKGRQELPVMSDAGLTGMNCRPRR